MDKNTAQSHYPAAPYLLLPAVSYIFLYLTQLQHSCFILAVSYYPAATYLLYIITQLYHTCCILLPSCTIRALSYYPAAPYLLHLITQLQHAFCVYHPAAPYLLYLIQLYHIYSSILLSCTIASLSQQASPYPLYHIQLHHTCCTMFSYILLSWGGRSTFTCIQEWSNECHNQVG